MKKTLTAIVLAALAGGPIAAAGAAEPEYRPTPDTYLLMHFNGGAAIAGQGPQAAAELFGDARLAEKGWSGGAFEPGTGGLVVRTDRPFNPQYGIATIEARVFLREYPKDRAYVIDKVFECANPVVHNAKPEKGAVGISVFVDAKGRIGNEITSLYYGPNYRKTFLTPDGWRMPLNTWVHIAVVNAGWPVGNYTIYADRAPVLRVAHEYVHRIFYTGERETTAGRIVIGNNDKRTAPFPGLIDEIRILGANLELTPPADISWTDPEKKRPVARGVPAFLPETAPRVAVSFEEPGKIETANPAFTGVFTGGSYEPGVRGRAFSGGTLEIRGPGIATGKEGAIEFWMMPENWNNRMIQNHTFLSGGPEPWFNLYVFNSAGDLRPISLYFKNDEGQNTFVSFSRFLDERNWHHIVLTWKEANFRIFLNGLLVADATPRDISKMVAAQRTHIRFSGAGQNASRFDEICVYDRQLAPDEAWNAYWRYRDPARMVAATPYAIRFKQYPSAASVRTEADFLQGRRPAAVRLVLKQGGRTFPGAAVAVAPDSASAAATAATAPLKPGPFDAELLFLDAKGTPFLTVPRRLEKKEYPWLGNALGVPRTVPEPWKPLEEKDRRVRTLLSEYDFSDGLLRQVTTDGRPLLAAPVSFETLDAAGKATALRPRRTDVRLAPEGLGATVSQSFPGTGWTIESVGEMEFDGFVKYRLSVRADAAGASVGPLRLRVPLRADQALDYYVLGEHMDHMALEVPAADGVFWESLAGKMFGRHELPEYGAMKRPRRGLLYGSFVPFAWAGNNRRGLCFMADNDRGWTQSDRKGAVELSREKDRVCIDLNLIPEPCALSVGAPREIVLSLMATPSKRPPKGWRHWTTDSFYTISAAGRVLDSDMFYVPYPVDYEKSASFMQGVWKRGATPLPYMDFYGSDTRMDPAEEFRWEWWPSIVGDEFARRSSVYPTNYCAGSIGDWYIHNFNQWVERSGVNGLYIDNAYPSPMAEAATGPGYVHEKGGVQPGYQLFAMRDWFKRVYCLMASKGKPHPYTMIHMTHCMIAPAMSFADIAYEGEDHYINGSKQEKEGADHITYWPNHIVRVIDLPHTWGVGTHWLGAVHGNEATWELPPGRDYYIRAWYAQLLLHDQRGAIGGDKGAMAAFDAFLEKDPDVEFVLYRENRAVVPAPADDCWVSLYRRPGRVLAVVANHAREDREIRLSVDLKALGMGNAEFLDAETGKPADAANGRVTMTVPKRNYRLLLIRAR